MSNRAEAKIAGLLAALDIARDTLRWCLVGLSTSPKQG